MKKLKLGIPKGSLQEKTLELFKKAGFDISVSSRSYFPTIDDVEIELILVRAQEMSRYVEEAILDCGITGEDWILENDSKVLRLEDLGFAKRTKTPVRWVIAVKENSKIKKIEDLKGKRVATELLKFTKRYFKNKKIDAEIEFSWGATEVKVRSGLVDAIVDLTETGQSLRANGLKEIETICTSTTKFIANKTSYTDNWKKKKIDFILVLLKGALEGEGKVGLKLNISDKNLEEIKKLLPSLTSPTVSPLTLKGWYAIEVIIEEKLARDLIPQLKEKGAKGIIEYPLNKLIY